MIWFEYTIWSHLNNRGGKGKLTISSDLVDKLNNDNCCGCKGNFKVYIWDISYVQGSRTNSSKLLLVKVLQLILASKFSINSYFIFAFILILRKIRIARCIFNGRIGKYMTSIKTIRANYFWSHFTNVCKIVLKFYILHNCLLQ